MARYYLTDHLGSTRAVVDDAGTVLETFDYYPFGLLMPKRSSTTGNTIEKFTGKERDEAIGLDYFGARYYDAALGRWHGVDPLGDVYPSTSLYNYVLNNPISNIDPDGRAVVETDSSYIYTGDDAEEKWTEIRNNDSGSLNRTYSNPEQPDPEKPAIKNYHNLTNQERIDQILSYLFYLNSIGADGGDFRDIFNFNKSGVELGPIPSGLRNRPKIGGVINLGGTNVSIEIEFGFYGSQLQQTGLIKSTSFVFKSAHLLQKPARSRGDIFKNEGFHAIAYNKVDGYDKPLSFLVGFTNPYHLKLFAQEYVPYPKLIIKR